MVISQAMATIVVKINKVPNQGAMGRVRRSKLPPPRPMAITPRTGSSIPVSIKPISATAQCVPVAKPICGGKIKFPAPKNTANMAKPMISVSLRTALFPSIGFSFFAVTGCA